MPTPTVTIPLRWTADDGLFVPVTIGKETVDLILDTGSNQDALTTAVAKRMGAHVQSAQFRGTATDSVPGPNGQWLPMTYGRIDQLRMGSIVYDTLLTQVWDMAAVGHRAVVGFGINVRRMELYLYQ